MDISRLNDITDDFLYASLYQHERQIYGEKLLKALKEITAGDPIQEDETDEEYVVKLIKSGAFWRAKEMLETLLGR